MLEKAGYFDQTTHQMNSQHQQWEQAISDLAQAVASKHGFTPEAAVAAMDTFFDLPQLELHGLMTMAPFSRHPESARPYFQKLRKLKNACEDQLGAPLPELSMGMSGDYEIAIEEGATLIRLGTTLFGPRAAANKD